MSQTYVAKLGEITGDIEFCHVGKLSLFDKLMTITNCQKDMGHFLYQCAHGKIIS